MIKDIDLNYLKYFYEVVRTNGFTKAADFLRVKQPVVSRAVDLLEKSLGGRLLERQRGQIVLTGLGRQVYQTAEEIFFRQRALQNLSEEVRGSCSGEYTIGTTDSLACEPMAQVISELKKRFPFLTINHQVGTWSELSAALIAGKLDIAFLFNIGNMPEQLIKKAVANVPFVGVESVKNAPSASYIAAQIPDGSYHKRFQGFEKMKKSRPNLMVTQITSSSHMRLYFALAGLGVSTLPRYLVENFIKEKRLRIVDNGEIIYKLYLVQRKSGFQTKLVSEFCALVKKYLEGNSTDYNML